MTALYEAIADDIRRQISSGRLRPGDTILSMARLMEHYGASYGTVRSALLVLRAERLIRGQPGDAVYVAERPDTTTGGATGE